MKIPVFVLSLALVMLAVGCTLFEAKETLYLKSALDQATEVEVRQHLGLPRLVTETKADEAIWVYEVYEKEAGSQQSWASTGSWCDEYVLTFDKKGILRRWTHKSQRHGGENMPTYCVTDGFKPPS